ncbi:MAG: glycogen debranching enzyme GlgX, partial [Gammaproteobacteria bacterium]|nr:glycogen debranching enzyme GlgX [Gammaproteobacteria bacterium]
MTRQLPTKLPHHSLSAGTPAKLGAHFNGEGVNFAVFSSNAESIELCLFTDDGKREIARIPLKERTGDIWHIFVAGLGLGTKYGYRVFGPYAPEQGHRFNPHKLLLDPYARQLHGALKWSDTLMGYRVGSARNDLSFDTRDNAFAMPKSVVVNDHFAWADDRSPQFDPREAIHYEAHIKGMTAAHPKVEAKYRGKYLGMASEPVLEHLTKLGINTVQLMPVHAFINDRFLIEKGLTNYWGYNTIGF